MQAVLGRFTTLHRCLSRLQMVDLQEPNSAISMHASPVKPQSVSGYALHSEMLHIVYPHLRDLDLRHEALAQVLKHDAVTGGKEGQDVTNEVLLVRTELFPVRCITAQVHLLGCM